MVKKSSMNVVIPSASSNALHRPHTATPPTPHLNSGAYVVKENLQLMHTAKTQIPSPGSALSDFTDWARQIRMLTSEDTREVDVQIIKELHDAMKRTVGALDGTLNVLGDQAAKLAQLGPAIDVAHRVSSVRKELAEQEHRQDERMQHLKQILRDEIKAQLSEQLADRVNQIVKEVVQGEIRERVRRQLNVQIPDSARQEIRQTKLRILGVRADLHNSEARRHNALIRSTAIDEPLKPVLRPLPPGWRSPDPSLSPAISPSRNTPVTAATSPTRLNSPVPVRSPDFAPIDQTFSPPSSGHAFELPGPSPLFPRDLESLLKMKPESLQELLNDYGLLFAQHHKGRSGTSDRPDPLNTAQRPEVSLGLTKPAEQPEDLVTTSGGAIQESQEDQLNRFMAYIGISFHVVPAGASLGSSGSIRVVSV